jgi:transcriptional regulator with XRE-family HTH domain
MIKNKHEQSPPLPINSGGSVARMRALDIAKIIGENIKAKRISLGLTQTDLGNLVNMSYQQIQKYEAGKNIVSAALLYDLSLFLNIPVSNFYQGLEIRNNNDTSIPNSLNTNLSAREISEVIKVFSSIDSKKLRQSLVKTITHISEKRQDD